MASLMLPDGRELLIIANNDSPMQSYVTRKVTTYYHAAPSDVYALITLKDGKQRKLEFYYGSTYLSNSSRVVKADKDFKDIVVYDIKGNSRKLDKVSH
jgi:hypothetical protein